MLATVSIGALVGRTCLFVAGSGWIAGRLLHLQGDDGYAATVVVRLDAATGE